MLMVAHTATAAIRVDKVEVKVKVLGGFVAGRVADLLMMRVRRWRLLLVVMLLLLLVDSSRRLCRRWQRWLRLWRMLLVVDIQTQSTVRDTIRAMRHTFGAQGVLQAGHSMMCALVMMM
jgi:hypothetical protein